MAPIRDSVSHSPNQTGDHTFLSCLLVLLVCFFGQIIKPTLVLAVSVFRLWGEAELHVLNSGVKKQSVHIPGMSTT